MLGRLAGKRWTAVRHGALLRVRRLSLQRGDLDRGRGKRRLQPGALYGSSEVQALFSIADGDNRLHGGGVPVSEQARLAVRDPETGTALPHWASGELWIDAPSRFIEYLDNPAATARAIDADGMFRTGDLAHLAEVGFIYEARIGDAMRLGRFLVSPEEIEAVIQAEPGVDGVQVVSASSSGKDPVPVAFVRPRAGATLQEATLRASCLRHLARFKVPERIVVVDDFPIVDSPNGAKVQKVRCEIAQALLCEEPDQPVRTSQDLVLRFGISITSSLRCYHQLHYDGTGDL